MMIITVKKIGDGTILNPYRPDTDAIRWVVRAEREDEFDIEVSAD
jgi:hypothetical protein